MNTIAVPVEPTAIMYHAAYEVFMQRVSRRGSVTVTWTDVHECIKAAFAAAPPQSETADQLVLPEIIGPCSEIVERITDELGDIEGCETDQELVTQVLHAIKRLIPAGRIMNVAATQEADAAGSEGKSAKCNGGPLVADLSGGKPETPPPSQPTASAAAPDAPLREQISDAKARQAAGEGVPGDAELSHCDENVTPTWYFVGTDTNLAQCRKCLHRELVRIAEAREECPVCQPAERRAAQRRIDELAAWVSPTKRRRVAISDRRQNAAEPDATTQLAVDHALVSAAPTTMNLGRQKIKLPLSAEQIRPLRLGNHSIYDTVCDQALLSIELENEVITLRGWKQLHDVQKALREQLERQLAEKNTALHASAPHRHKCSDCQIDSEPCPVCYRVWWQKRHPNTNIIIADDSEVFAAIQRAEKAEAELDELKAGMFAAKKAGKL